MKNMKRKRILPSTNKLFPVLILVATLFMGIGYASINSIIMNINGEIVAKAQDGIYITNVEYVERSNALPKENYSVSYADNTILKSTINLEPNDLTSEVSLKVSFYNSTGYDYIFKNVVYAEELTESIDDIYSNKDIVYTFNNQNKIITKNGGSLEVIITFKYSEINESTSNVLNSILNFSFKKIYNVTYNAFSDTTGLPTTVVEGETLVVDVSKLNYYYFTIYGEDKLILDKDYTFINKVITINDVKSDIVITTFGAVTKVLITLSNQHINTANNYGDFQILDENRDLTSSMCTYQDCYSDNNGKFQYDANGGLILDQDNQIGVLNIDSSMKVEDSYTAYMTIKADANQLEPRGLYATAILAISEANERYLLWIGFYDGYMHIYTYETASKKQYNYDYTEEGFISMNASKYSNKVINIQLIATRNQKSKLYINGTLIKTFNSGDLELSYNSATLGDLRPGRNLKFKGTIYDIALYNRALTEEEIQTNWNYANEIWNIT